MLGLQAPNCCEQGQTLETQQSLVGGVGTDETELPACDIDGERSIEVGEGMTEINGELFTTLFYLFNVSCTSFMKGDSHHSEGMAFHEERVVFVDEIQSFKVALKSEF